MLSLKDSPTTQQKPLPIPLQKEKEKEMTFFRFTTENLSTQRLMN